MPLPWEQEGKSRCGAGRGTVHFPPAPCLLLILPLALFSRRGPCLQGLARRWPRERLHHPECACPSMSLHASLPAPVPGLAWGGRTIRLGWWCMARCGVSLSSTLVSTGLLCCGVVSSLYPSWKASLVLYVEGCRAGRAWRRLGFKPWLEDFRLEVWLMSLGLERGCPDCWRSRMWATWRESRLSAGEAHRGQATQCPELLLFRQRGYSQVVTS